MRLGGRFDLVADQDPADRAPTTPQSSNAWRSTLSFGEALPWARSRSNPASLDQYCVGPTMAIGWGEDDEPVCIDRGLVRRVLGCFLPATIAAHDNGSRPTLNRRADHVPRVSAAIGSTIPAAKVR